VRVLIRRERGAWWFRVGGYGLHYLDTRRHRPLLAKRKRLGVHRFDLHLGPLILGPLLPDRRRSGAAERSRHPSL
jgi:hypothetical protein